MMIHFNFHQMLLCDPALCRRGAVSGSTRMVAATPRRSLRMLLLLLAVSTALLLEQREGELWDPAPSVQ